MLTVDSIGNINEIDDFFIKNNIEVVIYGGRTYVFHSNKNWKVGLRRIDDGIELKIETFGVTLYEAMADAYVKFYNTVNNGASNLLAPVIEHKTLSSDTPLYEHRLTARPSVDDDIPF